MWLLAGQKAPDHSTIARFRSGFWVLTIQLHVVVSRTKSAGSQYHCPVPFRFLGFNYPSVTVDSGYESEEGYSYLREEGQQPYIKPMKNGKKEF